MEMEPKEKIRVEKAVREILEESDMETTTEHQIRKLASQRLDTDLNLPHYKAFVRHVVNTFLDDQARAAVAASSPAPARELDDDGDLIVCRLSDKRRVTIQNFRGKALVSIREFYKKDGQELPSAKGISLGEDQWSVLKKSMPDVDKAIKEMEERI